MTTEMEQETSSSFNSEFDRNKSHQTRVVLNVYDLTELNNYMYWFGLGIFHSGIEVHGKEYGFGAHDFSASGVFEVDPRCCPGFSYRCSVSLGQIDMSTSEFRLFIENIASEYHGDTYHLISKNCNHFTDDIAWRMTKKRIPGWVNRLATMGSFCSCLLPESLQVTAVKQLPEYHECSEDEITETLTAATTPPHESTELDDDQEKRLLSSLAGGDDLSFVKEAHRLNKFRCDFRNSKIDVKGDSFQMARNNSTGHGDKVTLSHSSLQFLRHGDQVPLPLSALNVTSGNPADVKHCVDFSKNLKLTENQSSADQNSSQC